MRSVTIPWSQSHGWHMTLNCFCDHWNDAMIYEPIPQMNLVDSSTELVSIQFGLLYFVYFICHILF